MSAYSRSPMTIFAPVALRLYALRSYVGSLAWNPLVQLSRAVCLSLFKKITHGQLEIIDEGESTICGHVMSSTDLPPVSFKFTRTHSGFGCYSSQTWFVNGIKITRPCLI